MVEVEHYNETHMRIGGLLKEAVFGFNDGLVSTFAVIAGLTGGLVEQKTVLLAALATLIAGAFSMGLGTYLGSKSEKDLYERERKREIYEMEIMPEVEEQEIRDIYAAKGFKGQLLEEIVRKITSDKKLWLDTMMREELGFAERPPKPGMNGIVMSIAFVAGSFIPTLPYMFPSPRTFCIAEPCIQPDLVSFFGHSPIFALSFVLSGIGLLAAGALKTRFTGKSILGSAFETLIVGALAAGGSYGVGVLLT